jgi:integrase
MDGSVNQMLTQKRIEALRPQATTKEYADGKISGLYFAMQPSGKGSWALRYRWHGKPSRLTLGGWPALSLATARDLAQRALGELARGSDPAAAKRAERQVIRQPKRDDDLVETVTERYLQLYCRPKTRARTASETARVLQTEIVARWRGKRLPEITRADVHAVLDAIVARGAPVAANRCLSALRGLFSFAIERGLIEASPCDRIRPPAPETSRERILSDDELAACWRATDSLAPPACQFIKILILTGLRRNEVAQMRYSEIDFETKTLHLPAIRCKNKTQHNLPLSQQTIELLRTLPRFENSDFIFTVGGEKPMTAYAQTKKRLAAKLPTDMQHWQFHDLRRTYASGCAKLGVPLHVVEKTLNHIGGSFRGVAGVYNRHSYSDEMRSAAETYARHVEALVSGVAKTNIVAMRKDAAS